MGPILFRWVACEMSLVSLVEVTFCFNALEYVSNVSMASKYDFEVYRVL